MRRLGSLSALVVSGAAAPGCAIRARRGYAGAVLLSARCRLTLPPAHYDWTGFYFGGHVGARPAGRPVSQAPGTRLTALNRLNQAQSRRLIGGAPGRHQLRIRARGDRRRRRRGPPPTFQRHRSYVTDAQSGASARTDVRTAWRRDRPHRLCRQRCAVYVKGGGAWMNANYTQDDSGARRAGVDRRNQSATPATATPRAAASNTA